MTASARTLRPAASRLLAAFALLAFFFQGLVVQTHIHGAPVAPFAPGIHQAETQLSLPSAPDKNDPYDPASCPLCQEMLHAGVAVTPVLPTLPLLLACVAIAAIPALLPAMALAPETGWQSRAPPRR